MIISPRTATPRSATRSATCGTSPGSKPCFCGSAAIFTSIRTGGGCSRRDHGSSRLIRSNEWSSTIGGAIVLIARRCTFPTKCQVMSSGRLPVHALLEPVSAGSRRRHAGRRRRVRAPASLDRPLETARRLTSAGSLPERSAADVIRALTSFSAEEPMPPPLVDSWSRPDDRTNVRDPCTVHRSDLHTGTLTKLRLGGRPEIHARRSTRGGRAIPADRRHHLITDFVATRPDRWADRRTTRRVTKVDHRSKTGSDDACGDSPPARMQHGHRGVPLNDDGHTVGGGDHERQPRVLRDQAIALARRAWAIHADHDIAVDLMNRCPRIGDAEGLRDAVSRVSSRRDRSHRRRYRRTLRGSPRVGSSADEAGDLHLVGALIV